MPLGQVCSELRHGVLLGLITGAPVSIEQSPPELSREMDTLAAEYAGRFRGYRPAEIPGLQPARKLYRSLQIDPTRTRPSSEALLRRALRGKPIPRILNAVDVCNLCSLEFLLPIGLYDSERISGEAVLRIGEKGESYEGIRKDLVHLEGRPVLVDDIGPFGNPTSDSLRTSVTPETGSLFMIIFAPDSYARSLMEKHIAFAERCISSYLSTGRAEVRIESSIYPPDPA
jgi:DNA/RNA-binding domain of Phe-tRNA-synthetase-like protein